MAKLQNDPQQLLGWKLRLLHRSPEGRAKRQAARHENSSSSSMHGRKRASGSRSRSSSDGGHNDLGRSLGCVVEVLAVMAPDVATATPRTGATLVHGGPVGGSNPAGSASFTNMALAPLPSPLQNTPAATNRARRTPSSSLRPSTPAAPPGRGAGTGPQQQHWQQPQQVMLRASCPAQMPQHNFEGAEDYIVRLDTGVLPYADMASRVLYVEPPEGLLEQGRRSLLLQLLRRELLPFLQAQPLLDRASGTAALLPSSTAQPLPDTAAMPSRQQLLAAGRRDLADLVVQAGGFIEVALRLGLRCRRRPRGYWSGPGSWERLREELAAFVAAAWVELPHPDNPARAYYYNQVSGRTTWHRPAPLQRLPAATAAAVPVYGGGGVRWVVVEAAADRVMPSQSAVLRARRYDLHNAISYHGGYTAVAERLGRRVTWALSTRLYGSPAALRRELVAVARELQLPRGVMPTQTELQLSGHGALLAAVRRCGGFQAVAGSLRLAPRGRRRPAGHWDDLGTLATELAAFAATGTSSRSSDAPSRPAADSDKGGSSSIVRGGGVAGRKQGGLDEAAPNPTPPADSDMDISGQKKQPQQQRQPQPQEPPATVPVLPSQQQLKAAGRYDLLYALSRHASSRGQVAELAGLRQSSRRGTNRNALRFEAVAGAVQAGCETPKAIRDHLQCNLGVDISRQHLTTYLAKRVGDGQLTKLSYGRYSMSSGKACE